jgi:hypothetical protein
VRADEPKPPKEEPVKPPEPPESALEPITPGAGEARAAKALTPEPAKVVRAPEKLSLEPQQSAACFARRCSPTARGRLRRAALLFILRKTVES